MNSQGPLYFQKLTKELVVNHRKEEEASGRQIWPATPAHEVSSKSRGELDFCASLDCANEAPELKW